MGELDIPQLGGPKAPALPMFKVEAVKLEFASAEAGRDIFEDREFVDIIIPGDRRAMVHEPVNEEHKARWPKEYEAFRLGREAPVEGTPLASWPKMSRARVEELAYFHIRTIEQLAGVDDNRLNNLGMGARQERESARVFLEIAAKGSAPIERMLARIEQQGLEIERLKRDLQKAYAEIDRMREEEPNARRTA